MQTYYNYIPKYFGGGSALYNILGKIVAQDLKTLGKDITKPKTLAKLDQAERLFGKRSPEMAGAFKDLKTYLLSGSTTKKEIYNRLNNIKKLAKDQYLTKVDKYKDIAAEKAFEKRNKVRPTSTTNTSTAGANTGATTGTTGANTNTSTEEAAEEAAKKLTFKTMFSRGANWLNDHPFVTLAGSIAGLSGLGRWALGKGVDAYNYSPGGSTPQNQQYLTIGNKQIPVVVGADGKVSIGTVPSTSPSKDPELDAAILEALGSGASTSGNTTSNNTSNDTSLNTGNYEIPDYNAVNDIFPSDQWDE